MVVGTSGGVNELREVSSNRSGLESKSRFQRTWAPVVNAAKAQHVPRRKMALDRILTGQELAPPVPFLPATMPSNGQPHPGKMLDLMMLVGPGGRERTEPEYAALLSRAGFQLTRVVPTESAVSVVEAALA